MKQFNLDEYLANPTKRLITRAGRPVRIICKDSKYYDHPIIALVSLKGGTEVVCTYMKNGMRFNNMQNEDDLFFAPEKHEGWVNIYRDSNIGYTYAGTVFDSPEDAESKAQQKIGSYVTTIKIEWEE